MFISTSLVFNPDSLNSPRIVSRNVSALTEKMVDLANTGSSSSGLQMARNELCNLFCNAVARQAARKIAQCVRAFTARTGKPRPLLHIFNVLELSRTNHKRVILTYKLLPVMCEYIIILLVNIVNIKLNQCSFRFFGF